MHGLVTGEDPRDRRGDLELRLENPLGFFESERLVETNEALFQILGCSWDRPPFLASCWDFPPLLEALQPYRSRLSAYALERSWVDKDPRLCITYSAYLHILLRRIPLVVALREPLAVASSLYARNGFSLNHGLVLWWVYNHHIASHLCSEDLLLLYSDLLDFDEQSLQLCLCPFLEHHKHSRPSTDQARTLIETLIRTELNRSEAAINSQNRFCVSPPLLEICNHAYSNIAKASHQLQSYREHFSSLPRPVLECSAREQIFSESDHVLLNNRLHHASAANQNLVSKLEQRERDRSALQSQIRDLQGSHSWKITAPLRALSSFFRSAIRRSYP